jgi:Tol biopolymer transport system component/imidazolonepropionase-like amidohydrolase
MTSRYTRHLCGSLASILLCSGTMAGTLEFKATEATDADVTVSPDGKRLVLTILGHLFGMPVTGGDAEQLTFGPCYDNDPTFSPDGRFLAFVSDRDGSGGNVFILELATKKLTRVTREAHAGQPTWSSDGKAILFLRYLPREQDSRRASIFNQPALCELGKVRVGSEGMAETLRGPGLLRSIFFLSGEQLAWTVVEQELAPARFFVRSTTHIEGLAPKEKNVVRLRSLQGDLGRVVAGPKGDGVYCRSPELRFVPLRDRGDSRVSTMPGGVAMTRFALAPDGKTAYMSGRGQIVKVGVGSAEREVIKVRANVKLSVAEPPRPQWSPPDVGGAAQPRALLNPQLAPGGRSLVFMAAGRLWQQTLDAKPARQLINSAAFAREPALSPDGRQLAFVLNHQGKRELQVLDLETGRIRTLVDLGSDSWARFPSWSSDGKHLVFQKSAALSAPFELVLVSITDGKTEKVASAAGDWSSRPHFAPEGDALYFTSRTSGPGTLFRTSIKHKAEPKAATQLKRHLNEARVAPDGNWLAFHRNTEIWVAPLGTKPVEEKDARRLSTEGGATFTIAPDSSSVIYSVGSRVWRQPVNGGKRFEIAVRLDWKRPIPPPLLLRRVRVLDFKPEKFSDETSLLVEGGAIRWIGAEKEHKLPDGVNILDAAGKYAIPGLFDFHVHSAWANHEANPETFLAYGITSVRDTGGGLEMQSALADRGEISGDAFPRYFFCGEIFEGPQPIWGDAFLQIYTAEDARNLVKCWKSRGAQFIKVYPSLPWPLQQTVAEEARRQGLSVAGHGLGLEEIVKSVTLGYTSLEHCPMSLNDDVQQLLIAAGTRCDPTLAILGGHSTLLRRDPKRLDDPKLRAFFSEPSIRAARSGGFPGFADAWPGRLAVLRAGYRAGIKLHAGTDSLMTGTFFGASLHWELEHLAEAGLKPIEVIRLATQDAAAGVGADGHLGALAPGKLADIALLDADPLENIRNTQAIWRVVKGGWAFDPNTLRATGPVR